MADICCCFSFSWDQNIKGTSWKPICINKHQKQHSAKLYWLFGKWKHEALDLYLFSLERLRSVCYERTKNSALLSCCCPPGISKWESEVEALWLLSPPHTPTDDNVEIYSLRRDISSDSPQSSRLFTLSGLIQKVKWAHMSSLAHVGRCCYHLTFLHLRSFKISCVFWLPLYLQAYTVY